MSGYVNLKNINYNGTIEEIPCIDATKKVLEGLGELVPPDQFDSTKIIFRNILKDPQTNRTIIIPEKETEGNFDVWEGRTGIIHAENKAVESGRYSVAHQYPKDRYKFVFREVNYHPEGSQLIMPSDSDPFILILGDTLKNLKAYSFDGSHGFHIYPGVWHQPPIIHYSGRVTFRNKQAATHLCVLYDSLKEDNKLLSFSYV